MSSWALLSARPVPVGAVLVLGCFGQLSPYVITSVALFTVPQTSGSLQFWYIFVTYNLCTTVCYTAINVPLGSLSTMMTRDSHERDMLSIVRMTLAPIGRLISVTFTLPVVKLFGNDQSAWVKAMTMWCMIAFILLIFSFAKCKENVRLPEKAVSKSNGGFKRNALALVKNPYFWATLVLWTVTCVHATLVGTDLPSVLQAGQDLPEDYGRSGTARSTRRSIVGGIYEKHQDRRL